MRGAKYLNPHKLKSLNVAKFKKAFSTSKPHFADPITGSALVLIPATAQATVIFPIYVAIVGTAFVFSL
jgi:hypothetical protein